MTRVRRLVNALSTLQEPLGLPGRVHALAGLLTLQLLKNQALANGLWEIIRRDHD